jgi:hypothetical protein
MPPRDVAGETGIRIDYGRGPKPVTVAQLNRTLTYVGAMQKRHAPVIHVPGRRENVAARPREHRSRSRTRTAARGSPDDSGPEPPQLVEIPPAKFRRQLRRALGGAA